MVKALKEKYQNKCQICGFTFKTVKGTYYSEAAHIIPISDASEGVDHPDNIWILCANHHKMLDRQAINATGSHTYEIDGVKHALTYK
jgi:predicted restriction endonuclease